MYKKVRHLKVVKPVEKKTTKGVKPIDLPFRVNDHRYNEGLVLENLRKRGINVRG